MSALPRTLKIGRLLLVALVVAIALIVVSDLLREPPPPSYEPQIRPSRLTQLATSGEASCDGGVERLLVIGWDGASWELLLPLLEAGRLPRLSGLLERASYGDLYGFKPSLSPALWTTIATGRSPQAHGIVGFDKRKSRLALRWERLRTFGHRRRELYSNADRRQPAIWNLLSEAAETHGDALVVGYHNSYPAEEIRGVMISNWLIHSRMSELMRANSPLPPRFARSLASPAATTETLLQLQQLVSSEVGDAITDFVAYDESERQQFRDSSSQLGEEEQRWPYFLRRAWVDDQFHSRAAQLFLETMQPQLTMVHFQAVDLAQHQFYYFHRPESFDEIEWDDDTRARLEAARPTYAATVDRFAEMLDAELGELLDAVGEETTLLLLSDHGFEAQDDPWGSGGHDDAPAGLWIAAGPGIRPGQRIDATHYDIFPTMVAALGLPLSEELPGEPLVELFCRPPQIERVARYRDDDGRFTPRIAPPPELTDERLKALESLGYLE